EQYQDKEREVVSAVVQKVEPGTLNAIVTIDKNEVYFIRKEQIPGEVLKAGDMIKVYVAGIANSEKRQPVIRISRTQREFVKRLFEIEVPEIADGTVEIKAISRVAGARSKIAVISKDPNVDAVGACIGPKKSRITAVVNELNGEKIDVITYSEDPAEFIAKSLAPAEVIRVDLLEDLVEGEKVQKRCQVIVPNNQLSLAIGNKGQNAKLAAGLTGYKIDILPEVPVQDEE
ncbi:MAG: transcription termination factor NusA, partial [Ruminococcus sp.]|nr:transcription termination factor NusA [Ruminococcus sp.]